MPAIDLRAPTRICHRLILAFSLAAAACAPAAPSAQFPARPPGCALEAIERLPQRPYVELETFSLPGSESMRDVLDIVNERACRDGADAVYAPKGGRSYSYAIALKWNDAPRPAGPAPAPSASPAPPPPAPPPPPPSPPAPPSPPSPPPAPSSAPQPPAPAPPAPAPPAPPGA